LEIDYLIVGQGIAGSNLAMTFMQKGLKVLVVDTPEMQKCSRIAAGIFNPITGVKRLKTWNADVFFPYLTHYYQALEKQLNATFFYPNGIYIPFETQEEQNKWFSADTDSRYENYLRKIYTTSRYAGKLNDHLGGMELSFSGNIDTQTMLDAIGKHLIKHNALRIDWLQPQDLIEHTDKVIWKDITAKKVIFTDGQYSKKNIFFSWLRYHLVKGEVLTIEVDEDFDLKQIVNGGCWVVPLGNRSYKVGSTYDNHYENENPTEAAKEDILRRFEKLINLPYRVIEQQAAIRPATYDRKAFIGLHPEHPNIAVFNGMGAKGISMSPYLALVFFDFLENNQPLPKEVDIKRCWKSNKG
jgi:glycine/D-amino acid oxidase-like deaminating enzyme